MRVRRLALAALAIAATGLASAAFAQSGSGPYPQRPVRVMVPHSVGGSPDQVGRLVSRRATELLGQPFVVEARIGAGGMVGTNQVLRAPADGYSLLFADSSAYAITPHMYRKAGFEPLKDLIPIAPAAVVPYVLAVSPTLNISNLKEFVAYAKQKPGGVFYGSSGTGTPHHLAMEMLASMAGIQVQHVPYAGASRAAVALGEGDLSAEFLAFQSAHPLARAGKLKIIAVSTASRMSQLPDVPTIAESGFPNFNMSTTLGFFAAAGTPREIVTRLHATLTEAAKSRDVITAIETLGLLPAPPLTLAEYARHSGEEFKTYGRLVTSARAYAD